MRQVKTLEGLKQAVDDRKAVVVPNTMWLRKPKPAAIIFNMQGAQIYKLLQWGMFIYEKKR